LTGLNGPSAEAAAGQTPADDGEVFLFGPYRLVPSKRVLLLREEQMDLGSRAFDILVLLVSRRGEVISRRQILKQVWPELVVDETNLRAQIAQLRRVLRRGSDGDPYIANVRGRGYVFVAPVQRIVPSQAPPAPGRSIRVNRWILPGRLHRLVGRQQALDLLCRQLRTHRFINIVGPGGIGKTSLAIELGHRVAPDFGNDVCYVDLGSLSAPDQVLPTVAVALGYPVQSGDLLSGLASFVEDRHLLLILDCCERAIEVVCETSAALFRGAPRIYLLATGREPLRAEGEMVHLLDPLGLPVEKLGLTAAEALAAPSVQLFMQRAAACGHVGELGDEDAGYVAAICRQLDGIPLALELAGSRLITYGFAGLLEVLGGRSILTWPGRRHEPRHRSLEATLDWSFQLLSATERRILARLSVFVGGFTMQFAQAVASNASDDRWAVARATESLADKSLIAIRSAGGTHSYRLLDVTRFYAEMKLAQGGEWDEVARRHAQFCIDHLSEQYGDRARPDPPPGTPALEVGNVRAALEWCFSPPGDTELGIALAAGASHVLLNLSMLGECLRWSQAALAHIPQEAPDSMRTLRLHEAMAMSLMYTSGNDDRVGTLLHRGLQIAAELGARDSEMHLLAGYNLYLTRRADFLEALKYAERFAALANAGGNPVEAAAAEFMLGSTQHLIGHQRVAHEILERGFARAAAYGVDKVYYFGYENRGRGAIGRARTAWLRGAPEQARRYAKYVIDASVAEGHPVSLCITYLYTTAVIVWLRDVNWAEELTEALIELATKYLLKPYLAGGYALKGELLVARGDIERGVRLLSDARDSLRAEQQNIVYVSALRAYSEGLARLGRADEAKEMIADAVAHAETDSPSFLLPDLIRTQGDVLLASRDKNVGAAEACYRRAIARAHDEGALGWELRSAISLARLWIGQDRCKEARSLLDQTSAKFSEGFGTGDLLEAQQLSAAAAARVRQSA
jgi:predicted ATPase/DNA-binding winged helix-turn-helix (wHTH) protein